MTIDSASIQRPDSLQADTHLFFSERLRETIDKINAYIAESTFRQAAVGLAIGFLLFPFTSYLSDRILIKLVGIEQAKNIMLNHPINQSVIEKLVISLIGSENANAIPLFRYVQRIEKIIMIPFNYFLIPIAEECMFRGGIQTVCERSLKGRLKQYGFKDSTSEQIAFVGALIFSSFAFGAIHFSLAVSYSCSPVLVLQPVIHSTVTGIAFGILMKATPERWINPDILSRCQLPIFAHIANNISTIFIK